jgi:hypothetical protein
MIQKMPDLFYIFSPNYKQRSFLSVLTTRFLFPLAITAGVLSSEIVMPNGLEATSILYLAILISSALIATCLSFLRRPLNGKVAATIYFILSAIVPFAIWYFFTLTI